jgi:hypothetical protein
MYSYLQFGNPTNNKTETGTANRRATTNSKPPGPIIMMTQSKTLSSSQVQFIILFLCRCTTTTQTELCYIMLSQNHFPEPNRRVLTFLHHPKMYCAGLHTLSTAGDALIKGTRAMLERAQAMSIPVFYVRKDAGLTHPSVFWEDGGSWQ